MTSHSYSLNTGFRDTTTVHGITTDFDPTTAGNVLRITDANGHATTFTYDYGVVKNTVTPGYTIERSIDVDGTVKWEKRRGLTTYFFYDDLLRMTEHRPALGDPTYTDYDNNGTYVRVRRGPSATQTTLDGFGRPSATSNNESVKTDTNYDACGRVIYESYPYEGSANIGTDYEYDVLERLERLTHPDNSYASYTYGNGVNVDIRNERGKITKQFWSAFGDPDDKRLVAVHDANNKVWNYEYNGLGSLTKVTAPGGFMRTWEYFPGTGRLKSELHPESGTVSYTYHPAGNLKTRADSFGTTTYIYDNNNRLMTVDRPGTAHDVDYDWDESDNRTYLANDFVQSTFDFDDANRLETRTDVIVGNAFVTGHGYDGNDNLTSLTYPSGLYVEYDYDAENRINLVSDGGSTYYADDFDYHPSGAPLNYTAGNGRVHQFTYHSDRYWPKTVDTGDLQLTYTYDDSGNVETISDPRFGLQSFLYDNLDRMTTANGYWPGNSFSYDERGNRKTTTVGGAATFVYSTSTDRLDATSGVNFYYDPNGNLTSDSTGRAYTYTPSNMMETALANWVSTTYRYDGDDVRKAKTSAGDETYFIHGPGGQLLAEFQDANAIVPAHDYVYIGSRLLADVRLSAIFADGFESGDTSAWSSQLPFASTLAGVARDTDVLGGGQARVWRYYDTDGVGSVRVITDEGGDVVERHDYLPFGEECTTGACETNPQGGGGDDRKFTGKERDNETGLDYFGARYYSAPLARFATIDPAMTIQANVVDPQRWNRYAYANNNPLKFIDPDGREITYASPALEALFTFLSARSESARATLAQYEGPDNPTLAISQSELGENSDGLLGGLFTPSFGYTTDVPPGSGDFEGLRGLSDADIAAGIESGRLLTSATLRNATLKLDTSLNLSMQQLGRSKQERRTIGVALHELGHADLAAKDPLRFYRISAPVNQIRGGKRQKHGAREVEQDANGYRDRNLRDFP